MTTTQPHTAPTSTEDGQRTIDIRSPHDGSSLGAVAVSTPADVENAIVSARVAKPEWARTSPAERGATLRRAAAVVRDNVEQLAELNEAETGKPRDEAREGVLAGAGTLEQYAELGPLHRGKTLQGDYGATDFMISQPRGVVAVITPWNDPVAVACGLLGAALVTGNTVVHKPSERCPRTGELLCGLLADVHPDGVLCGLVGDGEVGAALTGDPRIALIAHVGSTAAGRDIAIGAAGTGAKVLLENGGNDPLIVDRDVHPGWAARQAAMGAFANAGQICVSVERVYVHEAVLDPFLRALVDAAADASVPPLVDHQHREQVHDAVMAAVDAGAYRAIGGTLPSGGGSHYPATVLTDCTPSMAVMSEETFGPVAPVRAVRSFDHALAEATDSGYGLAATVLTSSMAHAQQAWRELPVGSVKINAVFGGAPGGAAHPRGRSGEGFGYGPELLEEMTTTKVVHSEPPTL